MLKTPITESHDSRLGRLADGLIRFRLPLLLVGLGLTALAWPVARQLRFDESIESLYAADDPHLTDYVQSKQAFGGDEFIIVAYTDPQLFEPNSLQVSDSSAARIKGFADQLSQVPGVQGSSTQNLADALRFPYRRERVKEMVEGVLLGDDGQTTAIVLRLSPEKRTPKQLAETIRRVRELADMQDPPAYVVGEPVQVHDMFRYVKEDGTRLFLWSLALLAGVILVLFRSPRWVILPLLVVIATIRWTEALLVVSQLKLSMVSSMLNSLVTIISIATVTHITVHYREQRRYRERTDAFRQTFIELAPAIFWTCATTAVGFGALLSSNITPVRSFGIMMAIGTLVVLLAVSSLLPGGILLGLWSADPSDAPAERRLLGALGRITDGVERRPRLLAALMALIVVFAGLGFFRLEVETDFSKNFRKNSPIVRSLNFVESKLGGAGTWEVNFPAPAELTDDYLTKVQRLTERLRSELGGTGAGQLTKVASMTDGLDLVPKLPFVTNTLEKRLKVLTNFQPEFESSLYNRQSGRMRIILRAQERQPAESKDRLISDVNRLATDEFPGAKTTGLFVLLTFLIESLLHDQWVSFLLAAMGIATMMAVAFRSIPIGLISLVPNVFPIVLVIGTMGWIGLPINIATAMIASVSMGLTVDSSIHYLSGYRRARRSGLLVAAALRETHQSVGRALVFANLALVVGFSVLTLSHFIPLIYFGILVSAAMLGGLIGNLLLLPLLIGWVESLSREPSSETLVSESTL